ncbi:MAG: PIN domain-containing protein [Patescibacteria group bacterium]
MQKSNPRVFLDTSVILAGLNSPHGAAGTVLAYCSIGRIFPLISEQVIEEAERNIGKKFPRLTLAWQSFLLTPLEVVKNPTLRQVRKAFKVLPTSDAPILAAAVESKPDCLITWNTRDFMRPKVVAHAKFPIFTPGEFLAEYRR